jgi:N-acetylglutamate synthase-like GNAT family acetyltransferase
MREYPLKNGQSVIVREAIEDDSRAIEDVVNNVASERIYLTTEGSREDWNEAIRDIGRMKGLMVFSEVHGKVLGMTHLVKRRYDKNSHVGFLGMSIVFGFRSVGIGTAMTLYILEWAKLESLEKISP